MPITVEWFNSEKTIILQTYEGKWDWDDFGDMAKTTQALLDSVEHDVDTIATMDSIRFPSNFISHLNDVASAPALNAKNARWFVVVGGGSLVNSISVLFRSLYSDAQRKVVFAKDLEDAQKQLADRDA